MKNGKLLVILFSIPSSTTVYWHESKLFIVTIMSSDTFMKDAFRLLEPFHDEGRYHIETSPLIADWFLYDNGLRHERVKVI